MIRIRTVFTGVAGSPWYVNMHFDGENSAEAQAAASAVFQFWTTFKGIMRTPIVAQVEQTAAVINPTTGEQTGQVPVTTNSVTMTSTGESLPHQIQGLIPLKTGFYVDGKQIQGRIFIPGLIGAANVGDGQVNPSVVTQVNSAIAALIADTTLGVYSPTKHVFTNVASAQMSLKWATLRTRRD